MPTQQKILKENLNYINQCLLQIKITFLLLLLFPSSNTDKKNLQLKNKNFLHYGNAARMLPPKKERGRRTSEHEMGISQVNKVMCKFKMQ